MRSMAFYPKDMTFSDFELPKNKRPTALFPKNLLQEALVTEHLVNLLQMPYLQPTSVDLILENLTKILIEKQLEFPNGATRETINTMLQGLKNYMQQWVHLESGEKLLLQFEVLAHRAIVKNKSVGTIMLN